MKKLLLATVLAICYIATFAQGDSCQNPITINLGDTLNTNTTNGNQWFKFTAPQQGTYAVTTLGLTTQNTDVNIYNNCDGEKAATGYFGAEQTYNTIQMEANQTVFIEWTNNFGQSTEFDFTVLQTSAGQNFNQPISIENNGSFSSNTSNKITFYSFVTTTEQVISAAYNANIYIRLYNQQGNELDYGSNNLLRSKQPAGTYIISIINYDNTSYNWQLITSNPVPGEFCDIPLVLSKTQKINVYNSELYMQYTATTNGRIAIDNLPYVNFKILPACAQNPIVTKNGIQAYNFDVKQDETVLFTIYAPNNKIFTFDFIESTSLGESLTNPVQIETFGQVTAPVACGVRYFNFKVPEKGVFKISQNFSQNNEKNSKVSLKKVTLINSNQQEFSSVSGEISYDAQKNEEVTIIWELNENGFSNELFSWLIEPNNQVGNSCDNALIIPEPGDIVFPEGYQEYFYSFTPNNDCIIEVSNGDLNNNIYVYTDCNSEQGFYGYLGEISFVAQKNNTYTFKWTGVPYTNEQFTWTLATEPLTPGISCAYPINIDQTGEIDFTNNTGKLFYTYTATINGALRISDNNAQNHVQVYTNCQQLNNHVYNNKGEITTSCFNGTTYIIEWENTTDQPFTWSINQDQGEIGEVIANPIIINSLGNIDNQTEFTIENKYMQYVYYSYTAPKTQKLILTDNDKANAVYVLPIELYDMKGEIETEIIENQTYIIRWTGAMQPFNWYAYVSDYYPGETELSAIVIENPGDIEYPEGVSQRYYSYTPKSDVAIFVTDNDENAQCFVSNPEFLSANTPFIFTYYNFEKTAFTFNLAERDIITGETCANAINITNTGQQQLPNNIKRPFFSYTLNQNSTVIINDDDIGNYLQIWRGCSAPYYEMGYNGKIAVDMAKNETIIVEWLNQSLNTTNWNITAREPLDGESQTKPKTAVVGSNNFIGSDIYLVNNYFLYTPATNQQVTISDNANNVVVKNATTGDTIIITNYSETVFDAIKDTPYIIIIKPDYFTENTNWQLSASNTQTDSFTAVFNISDGFNAVKNAEISINNQNMNSNDNGQATFTLEPGKYNYTITANGFNTYTNSINVSNYNTGVTTILTPVQTQTYMANFLVTYNNQPVPLAIINILGNQITTNQQGIAAIELENGTYNYTVNAYGYKTYGATLTIDNQNVEQIIELTIASSDMFTVTFNVMANSLPVANASISINNLSIVTNNLGIAEIQLENGDYNFTVTAQNYNNYTGTLTVNNQQKTINIELNKLNNINSNITKLNIYPNPATSYITINTNQTIEYIEFIELNGKTAAIKKATNNIINLQSLKPGLYIVKIKTNHNILHSKLIIE